MDSTDTEHFHHHRKVVLDRAALEQGWVNVFLPLKNRFQFSDCVMYLSAAPACNAVLDKGLTMLSHYSASKTENPPSVLTCFCMP